MDLIRPLDLIGLREARGWLAAGLVLRLLLIALALPETHLVWFLPFLLGTPGAGLDPWTSFLMAGGPTAAFPYGATYLIAFGPAVWLGGALAGLGGAHIALGLAVLGCDAALTVLIRRLGGSSGVAAAKCYWLSPIVLYVGFWHGQLDALPAALLLAALWAVMQMAHRRAGLWLGSAVVAKFSMGLALPFIAIYYIGRARLRAAAPLMAGYFGVALCVLALPLLASPGFREMVLKTPETQKAFSLAINFGSGVSLYLLPLAGLALVYWAWRVRRLDFDLLLAFIGIAFMAVLLLTPASPGWALWAMPFIALHVARAGRTGPILYWSFAGAFVALHLLISNGALTQFGDFTAPLRIWLPASRLPSVLLTVMLGSGAALALQMARRGVLESPFYRASRTPFALGIAGDSGTGKDTLVEALAAMFGVGSVTHLSGDDYHIWDRAKPMWRAMTHLNPQANDLETFNAHVGDLADGHPVSARHYDHGSGRMGEAQRIAPREMLIVSGLHALWSPALRARYDVRIYMDMDEPLRRFLKLRRDVGVRGHAPEKVLDSIERRIEDGDRFVRPQAAGADIVFRLEPRHPSAIADTSRPLDATLLRLVVTLGPGRNFERPARLLAALCGMQIIETPSADGRTQVLIEGEPTAADIAAAARRLAPDLAAFLAVEPQWQAGLSGVMQLVVLTELDRARRRRGQI